MALNIAELLQPVSAAEPCGPSLRHTDEFEALRDLASAPERPDWARAKPRAIELAQRGRDMRVWVWLCRASLCADGLPGLADGLQLIAEGAARYWDELPPFDPDETDPRERFLGRLMALAELGITNYRTNLADLTQGSRNLTDLRADLEKMRARTPDDETTRAARAQCRKAITALEQVFRERCGEANDPQLGFDFLEEALGGPADPPMSGSPQSSAAEAGVVAPQMTGALGRVNSRADVIRALDLILEYYRDREPSSPVPLLVGRAKRLVDLSFYDALKELAPSGLTELQTIAGPTEDSA
jgi:type VI secretion system protein ImpA